MSRCAAEIRPAIPHAAKPFRFAVHPFTHPERNQVESFVRYGFARAYDARITSFMPTLFSLTDANGRLVAAAGCRPAADQALFLEQYLDEPIEQLLAQHIAVDIQRHDIVEVGNLVGETAGATRVLISAMGRWLGAEGYRAVCCNVTNTVANAFRKHGIPLAPLIAADKRRLGDAAHDWGRYYERPCTVMAALIPESFRSGVA